MKGVEDGMGDEQAVRQVYPEARCFRMTGDNYGVGRPIGWEEPFGAGDYSRRDCKSPGEAWADARAKLPAAVPVAMASAPLDSATTEVRGKASPELEQLRAKVEIIANWTLPPSGMTWSKDAGGGEMSYEAAYGTNGSRDYMKSIASEILDILDHIEGKG